VPPPATGLDIAALVLTAAAVCFLSRRWPPGGPEGGPGAGAGAGPHTMRGRRCRHPVVASSRPRPAASEIQPRRWWRSGRLPFQPDAPACLARGGRTSVDPMRTTHLACDPPRFVPVCSACVLTGHATNTGRQAWCPRRPRSAPPASPANGSRFHWSRKANLPATKKHHSRLPHSASDGPGASTVSQSNRPWRLPPIATPSASPPRLVTVTEHVRTGAFPARHPHPG
jgi:hypothetical protein